MNTIAHPSYPNGYVRLDSGPIRDVGPACAPGMTCGCGRRADCECQGCGTALCVKCWWGHSHPHKQESVVAP